jgi:6-bladed beta-propeller protein
VKVNVARKVIAHRTAALGLIWATVGGSSPLVGQLPEWPVAQAPFLSVGDREGEGHQLLFVRDATLRSDGSLVVLSAGTSDLRVYSTAGEFVRSVGREGEGPGEFKTPTGFVLLDSGHLLAYDPGNLRVTEFDADFRVVGTDRVAYSISAATPAFGRRRPMKDGVVPVAVYDIPMFETVRREEGVYADDLVVRFLEGTVERAAIRRPRGPVYQAREGSLGLALPLPLGEFVLFNWGAENIVLGSSHSNRFEVYGTSGELIGAAFAEGSPRAATAEDMAAFDKKIRAEEEEPVTVRGMQLPSRNARLERYLEDSPRGAEVPMFEQVEIGDKGHVWVREYVLAGEVASWQVLDTEAGVPVARVRVPAKWEILRASPTYMLVLERDEYDVEMVRAYAVGG